MKQPTLRKKITVPHVVVGVLLLAFCFLCLNMMAATYHNFFIERKIERVSMYGPHNGGAPKHMMVMLQGANMALDDFMRLAHAMAPEFPDTVFIAPEATMKSAYPGRKKWYTTLLKTDMKSYASGVQQSGALVMDFMAALHDEYNLPYNKIGLIGFSQGGTIAIQVAMNAPEPLWAAVSYAGILYPEAPYKEILGFPLTVADTEDLNYSALPLIKTPLLLYYGQEDSIVDYKQGVYAKEALQHNGSAASVHIVPHAAHGDIFVALEHAVVFLKSRQ